MSAALAVIGVNVFVCLTLRKKRVKAERMNRGEETEGERDRERESLWPSQLGYGTAAWTNP